MAEFHINVRAVLVGVVALPIIYAALDFMLHRVVGHPTSSPGIWILLAPISAVVLWLVPGFATGFIAKHSPLKHGLALGFVILAVAFAILALSRFAGLPALDFPLPLAVGFLVPVFLGSVLGAFIGNYVANRHRAP